MNIIKKFRIGLTAPKQIAQFRFERMGKTLLYFFVMILITLIPSGIDLVKFSSIQPALKNDIVNDFVDAGGVDCIISNQTLSCNETEVKVIQMSGFQPLIIVFDPSNTYVVERNTSAILFGQTAVYLKQSGVSIEVMTYESHPSFDGLDFKDSSVRSSIVFWNAFFEIIDSFILENKGSIISIGLIAAYISIAFDHMTTLLFMSALLFMLNSVYRVKFKELFKTTTYAMTPYILVQLIAILFNFAFIMYVGMIMTGVYAITAVRQMTNQFQGPGKED
jgi:hypothetical protein